MIGTHMKNNDVWAYMTPEEIFELEQGEVRGDYINLAASLSGILTVKLRDSLSEIGDIGKTWLHKSEEGVVTDLDITIYSRKYEDLIERGKISLHLGYAHINIRDISRLELGPENLGYNGLLLALERIRR